MAGEYGRAAIKKLIFFLVVICTIAAGAVWMVINPTPSAKPVAEEQATRRLAYEQAIAEAKDAEATGEETQDETAETPDIPAFETVTSEPAPDTTPPDSDLSAVPQLPPDEEMDAPQDMAALPDDGAAMQDDTPWQDNPDQGVAALPDSGQPGTDGADQWQDEQDEPWAYGAPPRQGDPYGPPGQSDPYGQNDQYGQGDPYGQQGGQGATQWADENTEEWVEVIVSGAPMRATAAEDAPMLFAFPYGRNLKVVSRYQGWVEVTDPRSSATGWMQAHVLAPSAHMTQNPYAQNEGYYDERPREKEGWLQRNTGEFTDMLNRAFGGN